jgi:hypothetical protein
LQWLVDWLLEIVAAAGGTSDVLVTSQAVYAFVPYALVCGNTLQIGHHFSRWGRVMDVVMVKDFGPLLNLASTATSLEQQRKAAESRMVHGRKAGGSDDCCQSEDQPGAAPEAAESESRLHTSRRTARQACWLPFLLASLDTLGLTDLMSSQRSACKQHAALGLALIAPSFHASCSTSAALQ